MQLVFIDIEASTKEKNNIREVGAIDHSNNFVYQGKDLVEFNKKLENFDYLVGHNILDYDLRELSRSKEISLEFFSKSMIDTLWLSSLVFIKQPYHKLVKDYKIDKTNDPIEDAKICKKLFDACIKEFAKIDNEVQNILFNLLAERAEFKEFFLYYQKLKQQDFPIFDLTTLKEKINGYLTDIVHSSFNLSKHIKENPLEFAYVFRLLEIKNSADKEFSVLPKWIIHRLPETYSIIHEILKHKKYNLQSELKRFFGYDQFRTFQTDDGEIISQEEVVKETLNGKNILTVFATGGGKSLTFQLPALINADKTNCLTLVISPLQSLMKDQIDNLNNKHDVQNVGFLNGLLSPIERKQVIEKVEYGGIDILYLSPEMLRSQNTKNILSGRIIDRIIIDEAHCFSKRGHDFRIDYMFIADFIKELGEVNPSIKDINISCFTATAKHEVIEEIKKYFHDNLAIQLEEFKSTVKRDNLSYHVITTQDEEDKNHQFIDFIRENVLDTSCIVFVRTTSKAQKISERINQEFGPISRHYHGKLDSQEKREIQDQFMAGEKRIIVATNAFGMGIDKDDVRYVIHYEVPTSIENYVQEAGRAGRDGKAAKCIIFYNTKDLDKNFQLIKLGEIKLKEIKSLLRVLQENFRKSNNGQVCVGAKELAYRAWINHNYERRINDRENLETKIRTALYFLEKQKFIKRSFNRTRVFATSKGFKSVHEGIILIDTIGEFDDTEKQQAKKILKEIISGRIIRVEDIPDIIGINMRSVLKIINTLRLYKLIEHDNDLSLYLNIDHKYKSSHEYLSYYQKIITHFFDLIGEFPIDIGTEIHFDKTKINTTISKSLKAETLKNELNDLYNFLKGLKSNSKDSTTKVKKFITIKNNKCIFYQELGELKDKVYGIIENSKKLLEYLYAISSSKNQQSNHNIFLEISLVETLEKFRNKSTINTLSDLEEILLFLHRLGIIKIDSGLFMFWTRFNIQTNSRLGDQFTLKHYQDLQDFYSKKIEQVHIMGEYVIRIANNNQPEQFLIDYFSLDYETFIHKYFKNRKGEIQRPMTLGLYQELFGELSDEQKNIIESSGNSLVIAGPGAGKTKTIVHKVVSLILKEGIRKEEFLLLSFSRSAKHEIKKRLIQLLGKEGYYLDIHTFHSFAFKVLGRETHKDDTEGIIKEANKYLRENDIFLPYSVIVLDEFQDINDEQYELIKLIKKRSSGSEDTRVIATGDDDQNIYGFQGGNIKYIRDFKEDFSATEYILTTNYRSNQKIVDLSSQFISHGEDRIKEGKTLISSKGNSLLSEAALIKSINFTQNNYTNQLEIYLKELLAEKKGDHQIGILSYTNEKVLETGNLLKKAGYKNFEILLNQRGYKLDQTLEFIRFLEQLKAIQGQEDISKPEIWFAYQNIEDRFGINKNTKKLKIAINGFFETHKKFYKKAIEEYFQGIDENDLIKEDTKITISTLHKAKGKEFDSIILLFDEDRNRNQGWENQRKQDETRRLIYVGLTRAKENLVVLGNTEHNKYFEQLHHLFEKKETINNKTSEIKTKKQIELITGLSDIRLGYNILPYDESKNNFLKIGENFEIYQNQVVYKGKVIQQFSKSFYQKLQKKYLNKGFTINKAEVFQRVVRHNKDTGIDSVVYLLLLQLSKE